VLFNKLLTDVAIYYESVLSESAKAYLFGRGIHNPSQWRFGYADNKLTQRLVTMGLTVEELYNKGLCNEDGTDFFRDGIVIPYILDNKVQTLRFRSLKEKQYLSLKKSSPLYAELFFNLDALVSNPSSLFICEGEFDTVMLAQAGYSAIGLPGSQVIPFGFEQELGKVKNIYLATDADKAGEDCARVLVNRLGRTCRRLKLPEGYDITDFILKFGYDFFKSLIQESVDYEPDLFKYEFDDVKQIPASYQSEVAIINLILKSPHLTTTILEQLGIHDEKDKRYFCNPITSSLFSTILSLYFKYEPIDLATVVDVASVPKTRIIEIFELCFEERNLPTYITNLVKAYLGRDCIDRSRRILEYGTKKSATKEGLENRIREWQDCIVQTNPMATNVLRGEYLIRERMLQVQRRMKRKKIGTGFQQIDRLLTAGFVVRGEMSVIGGRPREGKSAFKANLIRNLCEMGCCVVNVSPEQGIDSEHNRLDSVSTGMPLKDFFDSEKLKTNNDFYEVVQKNIEYITKSWKYHLLPSRDITFSGLVSNLERINEQSKIDVVFIDLFDKLKEITQAGAETRYMIDYLLNECNILARKMDIHICLLHQIKRLSNSNKKSDSRPTLEDLKESGRFEQDSYLVFLLHRRGLHFKDEPDDTMDVILAKQKDGICGDNVAITLDWSRETLILSDHEDDKM